MKKCRRILPVLMILCLLLSLAPGALAAEGAQTETVYVPVFNEETGIVESFERDVESITTDQDQAALVNAVANCTAALTVEGDVILNTNQMDVEAVTAHAQSDSQEEPAQANIEIKGSLESFAPDAGYHVAIYAQPDGEGADVTITVGTEGSRSDTPAVNAVGGFTSYGVCVIDIGGSADITVNGDVQVSGIDYAVGSYMDVFEGSANVTINGDIRSASEDYADGVYIYAAQTASANVTVEGSIVSEAVGEGEKLALTQGITVDAEKDGEGVQVAVLDKLDESGRVLTPGDVTATDVAIVLSVDDGGSLKAVGDEASAPAPSPILVIVEGTVSGDKAAIAVNDAARNSSVTIWKAEVNQETGFVVADKEDPTTQSEAAANLEKTLNYIVRWLNPDEGAALALVSGTAKLNAAVNGKELSYDVAHEDDEVVFELTLEEGYTLEKLTYDADKTLELTPTADGKWSFKVARGGGVLVTATLIRRELEKQGEGRKAPKAPAVKEVLVKSEDNSTAIQGSYTDKDGGSGKVEAVFYDDHSFEITVKGSDDTKIAAYKGIFQLFNGKLSFLLSTGIRVELNEDGSLVIQDARTGGTLELKLDAETIQRLTDSLK